MKKYSKLAYLLGMFIFGTVGIVSNYINISIGLKVLFRGLIGVITILIFMLCIRHKFDKAGIKKNLIWIILAGLSLGGNWVLLFNGYNTCGVAVSTLLNYTAPFFFIIIAPFIFKYKLSMKKIVCVSIAMIGMVLVSGVLEKDFEANYGILFGLGAAICYTTFLIFNKKMTDIDSYDKTLLELSFAIIVMLPYALSTTNFSEISITTKDVLLLIVIGVIHTGLAYILYIGSMNYLDHNSVAIFSYMEPIVSVALSWLILKEEFNWLHLLGGILIIVAAVVSDIEFKKKIPNQIENEKDSE